MRERFKLGKNCSFAFPENRPEIIERIEIVAGDDCGISFGGISRINSALLITMSDRCSLTIGSGLAINGPLRIFQSEPSNLTIGKDCLFGDSSLWTSDMHSIVDAETGERTNWAQDISIGDHVWIGHEVIVLKGSDIGSHSIVAARSVTSGSFPANSLIAGYPARVIRTGVSWDPRLIPRAEPPAAAKV